MVQMGEIVEEWTERWVPAVEVDEVVEAGERPISVLGDLSSVKFGQSVMLLI